MSGRRPFTKLTKDFTPERRHRIDEMNRDLVKAASSSSAASADVGSGGAGELPLWLIVTGPPAGGKTTLVRSLTECLGIPIFEKDVLKDTLYQSLGSGDKDWSRRIGLSAINLMFATASESLRAGKSLVTEANFYRQFDSERAAEILRHVNARIVQVHCSAATEVLMERNARRRTPAEQRPGHHVMPDEELITGIESGRWEPQNIPS